MGGFWCWKGERDAERCIAGVGPCWPGFWLGGFRPWLAGAAGIAVLRGQASGWRAAADARSRRFRAVGGDMWEHVFMSPMRRAAR